MEYWGDVSSNTEKKVQTQQKDLSSFKQYFKKNPSKFNKFVTMILGFYKEVYTIPNELEKQRGLEASRASQQSKRDKNDAAKKASIAKEESRKIHKAKEEISRIVDTLIADKDEAKLLIVLNKGYQLNEEQVFAIVDGSFNSDKVKEAVVFAFESSLKKSLTNALGNVVEFGHPDKKVWQNYRSEEYKDYFREKITILSKKSLTMWEHVGFDPLQEDDESAIKFLDSCKNVKRVINSFDEMKFSGRIAFENKINQYITDIELQKKTAIDEQFIKHLDKFKVAFADFDSMKINIVDDILKNVKNFKERDLPNGAKEIIKEINSFHSEITSDKLSVEQNLELTNLYKKRLPQVVEEYITISPRYKEKLKQHNENPDALLLDSLNEIKNGISQVFESVQEQNVTQLKVSNQYLKTKNTKYHLPR